MPRFLKSTKKAQQPRQTRDVTTVPVRKPIKRFAGAPSVLAAEASAAEEFQSSSAQHSKGWRRVWALVKDPVVCYYTFIVTVLALTAFGLLMVFSSSTVDLVAAGESPYTQLLSQGLFAIMGIIFAVVAAFIPLRIYQWVSFFALLVALGLQFLTLFVGVTTNGQTGWIALGPLTFQPAEVMKLALCIWIPQAITAGKARNLGSVKSFISTIIFVGIGFGMVMIGKDLGTGLIILLIGVVAVYVGGFNLKVFFLIGGLGFLGLVSVFVLGSANRMSRIMATLSGCSDTADAQGVCFQSIHGQYALASGGFAGLGLGASREKWNYLPEAHNDFIFAVIGEELGFVGASIVVLCFALIAWCLINIALKMTNKPYPRLVLVCITGWLTGQAFINILMVLSLLPVIGVPLPYVSAGGSALVMCLTGAGVAVRMAREQDDIAAIHHR